MKKIITLVVCVITLVGCETGKKVNSYGFEGEYEMRTITYWTNDLGEEEKQPRDMISPVRIYVENDHLYIRTNSFGMPNMDTEDLSEIEFSYDPPIEPSTPPTGEGNGEGIENVETNPKAAIIMRDGFVYVIRAGKYIKSLPIEALNVQDNKILFNKSDNFDIALTNADGLLLATMRNHFEYGPATLLNDTIRWVVELFGDAGYNSSAATDNLEVHVKYHNILVRK